MSSYATQPVWELLISQPSKAVFVCFLLAWWMDGTWNAFFQNRKGSIWWHIQASSFTLQVSRFVCRRKLLPIGGHFRRQSKREYYRCKPCWVNFRVWKLEEKSQSYSLSFLKIFYKMFFKESFNCMLTAQPLFLWHSISNPEFLFWTLGSTHPHQWHHPGWYHQNSWKHQHPPKSF